jgi:hypothetical protein
MSISRDSIEDIRTIDAVTATADAALPKSGGDLTGPVTTSSTIDGRTLSTDGAKLDGIAVGANNYALPSDIATEGYVDNQVSALVAAAPATLDTLNELAAALGDDPNFATTMTTTLGDKYSKAETDSKIVELSPPATKSHVESLGILANTITGALPAISGAALTDIVGVPSGIISMWSGLNAAIPAGWLLCDGTNGTPNLIDRFIVASGTTYTTGDTGGADTVNSAGSVDSSGLSAGATSLVPLKCLPTTTLVVQQ